MKKRLLSLLLVCVMLVTALPVFALVTVADTPYSDTWSVSGGISVPLQSAPNFTSGETVLTPTQFIEANPTSTDDDYAAYLREQCVITYAGPWSAAVVNSATGVLTPISRWYPFPDMQRSGTDIVNGSAVVTKWDIQWGVTEAHYLSCIKSFVDGIRAPSPWIENAGALNLAAGGAAFQPSTNTTVCAAVYTVKETAQLSFSLNDAVLGDGAVRLAILVDGQPVWPAGAKLGSLSTWYLPSGENATVAAINEAMKEVTVPALAGSTVAFCLCRNNGWITTSKGSAAWIDPTVTVDPLGDGKCLVLYADANGMTQSSFLVDSGAALPDNPNPILAQGYDLNGDGEVDELPATVTTDMRLIPVGDYSTPDPFLTPVIANGASTGRNGNWSAVHGHWSADVADPKTVNPTWSYDPEKGLLTKQDPGNQILIAPEEASLWANDGGGLYVNEYRFAIRRASSLVGMAAVYTAPTGGFLKLDVNTLQSARYAQGTPTAKLVSYFAIAKNGKIVWPSDGKPFCYTSPDEVGTRTDDVLAVATAYEPFPTISVAAGDEIAFIGNMGEDGDAWGMIMKPTVSYTALLKPTVVESTRATLGNHLSLDFTVSGDATADVGGVMVNGVKYDGEKLSDGRFKASYTGILPKTMTDDVTVTPYVTIGGSDMLGAPLTTTYAAVVNEMLETAKKGERAMAEATLHYGAAAQKYLEYNMRKLADAGLDPAAAPTGTYPNVYALTSALGAEADAKIETAAVLMRDTFALKFVISGDASYKVQMATDADFTDAVTKDVTPCKLGSADNEFKVIFDGLNFSDFARTYYIRVIDEDGVDVSETLTYSILTYAQRAGTDASDKLVTNALLGLYDAYLEIV